jgi:tetratricopeptide (TPR) repeat protein
VHAKAGEHELAIEEFRQALVLCRRAGHRPGEADILLTLGDALDAQGKHQAAYDAWQQASLVVTAFHLPAGLSLPVSERIAERLLTHRPAPGPPGDETAPI